MRAARGDLPALEHDDLVGQGDGREPVGDDERRAPAHDLGQRALDLLLGGRVHRRGGVVEDEDARVGQDRPRDGEALALAARDREPALADHRVVAVGQLGDERVRLRPLRRRHDLITGGIGLGVGDVLVHRGREQERVVGHERDLAPQRPRLDGPHVGAVDQDRPRSGVVEPRDERDQRGLARRGRADEGDGGARLHDQRDVAQGGLGGALVAQGHVAQLDPSGPLGQRRCALGHRHRGGTVEDLEHPPARGRGPLRRSQHVAERAHGRDQHQQVRVEGGEVADAERPVDDREAAEEQDRGQAEVGQEADGRRVEGLHPRRDHRLLEDARHRLAEAVELDLLAREGLDHAHAGDVLLGVGGQLGDALLDLLLRRPGAAAVAPGDDDHHRDRRQRDRGQAGVDEEHGHGGQHDGQRRLHDEDEPVAEEEAHRLQVDGRTRHELAGLLAVEEAELERLQVVVQALAQVDLDPEGHAPGHQPPRHRQRQPQHRRDHDHDRDEGQVALVVGPRVGVVGVGRARRGLVDRGADQVRQQHGRTHRQGGEDGGGDHAPAVGAQEAEQTPEHSHYFKKYRRGFKAQCPAWTPVSAPPASTSRSCPTRAGRPSRCAAARRPSPSTRATRGCRWSSAAAGRRAGPRARRGCAHSPAGRRRAACAPGGVASARRGRARATGAPRSCPRRAAASGRSSPTSCSRRSAGTRGAGTATAPPTRAPGAAGGGAGTGPARPDGSYRDAAPRRRWDRSGTRLLRAHARAGGARRREHEVGADVLRHLVGEAVHVAPGEVVDRGHVGGPQRVERRRRRGQRAGQGLVERRADVVLLEEDRLALRRVLAGPRGQECDHLVDVREVLEAVEGELERLALQQKPALDRRLAVGDRAVRAQAAHHVAHARAGEDLVALGRLDGDVEVEVGDLHRPSLDGHELRPVGGVVGRRDVGGDLRGAGLAVLRRLPLRPVAVGRRALHEQRHRGDDGREAKPEQRAEHEAEAVRVRRGRQALAFVRRRGRLGRRLGGREPGAHTLGQVFSSSTSISGLTRPTLSRRSTTSLPYISPRSMSVSATFSTASWLRQTST